MMSTWQDISTAPIGRMIDVWLWEVGDEGEPLDGYRFADVKVLNASEPAVLSIYDVPSGEWRTYYPHENGVFATHWMPAPDAPPLPKQIK